jgi:hypothetical protein
VIHVANLQLRPHSSLEKPWRFESLVEAMEFCRVIRRPFYAAVVGDTSRYQMWPGGRVHEYGEAIWTGILERNKRARAARKSKAPGGRCRSVSPAGLRCALDSGHSGGHQAEKQELDALVERTAGGFFGGGAKKPEPPPNQGVRKGG